MATEEPFLDERENANWLNWHKTSGVGGNVRHFYTPRNTWTDGTKSARKSWAPGLAALVKVVQTAEEKNLRVRCVGSGWSLNDVAFTSECLINTARLSYMFVGFRTPTMVTEPYRDKKHQIVFAQCGTQITTLNDNLQNASPRLALPTSGASNGQTILGATQTGTHGSAHSYGPMQNAIRALHIVGEGGKHYLVQSKEDPVATQQFADYLGTTLVNDTALFQAAVVAMGSFGLVHAVLFEATPMYGLGRFVKQVDFDVVKEAIYNFDITGLGLPCGNAMPWHFEVVVNPYRRGRGEGGAFIRTYEKFALPEGKLIPQIPVVDGQLMNSTDLVAMAGTLTDLLPEAIPAALQSQIEASLNPTRGKTIQGSPGAQFGDSTPTNGGASMELGVPAGSVEQVADAIFRVTEQHRFGTPVAFRWVKGSDQTLSYSRFSPLTCHIELPGLDAAATRQGFRMIWAALDAAQLKYTCHWGQALPESPSWIENAFGDTAVNSWREARRAFLKSAAARNMFSNELLDRYNLAN